MKKTIVMASLVAASTSMMAMDLQYFLGAGVERGDVDFKSTVNIPSAGYSENESFSNDATDLKMSGLAYGAQVGAIYDITKNIEFELGLAYTKYNVDKSFTGTESGVNYNAKIELEDSTSMSAGINYKF